MRKKLRVQEVPLRLSGRRALRLSQETVRALSSDELTLAVSGCPTGSWPTTTTIDVNSGAC